VTTIPITVVGSYQPISLWYFNSYQENHRSSGTCGLVYWNVHYCTWKHDKISSKVIYYSTSRLSLSDLSFLLFYLTLIALTRSLMDMRPWHAQEPRQRLVWIVKGKSQLWVKYNGSGHTIIWEDQEHSWQVVSSTCKSHFVGDQLKYQQRCWQSSKPLLCWPCWLRPVQNSPQAW